MKKWCNPDKPLWAAIATTAGLTILFYALTLKYSIGAEGGITNWGIINFDLKFGAALAGIGLVLAICHEWSRTRKS